MFPAVTVRASRVFERALEAGFDDLALGLSSQNLALDTERQFGLAALVHLHQCGAVHAFAVEHHQVLEAFEDRDLARAVDVAA